MRNNKSVVIVGSSGAGKTTLVNGLRTPEYTDRLIVPHRYITRPYRLGDDLIENSHLGPEVFRERVEEGAIWPFWNRTLDGGRVEQYGFEAHEDDTKLRVYSANNAFLRDQNKSVLSVLQNGLVVVAMAAQDARDSRLDERSPDMSAAERAVRLGDSGVDILDSTVQIEIIDTTNLSPEQGQRALQDVVNAVLSLSVQ
ncbi:MAG: hypothetical protein ABWX94_03775 [Candidatus Saccharimonadales bacterium]